MPFPIEALNLGDVYRECSCCGATTGNSIRIPQINEAVCQECASSNTIDDWKTAFPIASVLLIALRACIKDISKLFKPEEQAETKKSINEAIKLFFPAGSAFYWVGMTTLIVNVIREDYTHEINTVVLDPETKLFLTNLKSIKRRASITQVFNEHLFEVFVVKGFYDPKVGTEVMICVKPLGYPDEKTPNHA